MKKMLLFAAALLCASCSNEGPNSPVAAVSTNTTFECRIDGQSVGLQNGAFRHTIQRSQPTQQVPRQLCNIELSFYDPEGIVRCNMETSHDNKPGLISSETYGSEFPGNREKAEFGFFVDSVRTFKTNGFIVDATDAQAAYSVIVTVEDPLH
jgi:hypothetical protein